MPNLSDLCACRLVQNPVSDFISEYGALCVNGAIARVDRLGSVYECSQYVLQADANLLQYRLTSSLWGLLVI